MDDVDAAPGSAAVAELQITHEGRLRVLEEEAAKIVDGVVMSGFAVANHKVSVLWFHRDRPVRNVFYTPEKNVSLCP